MWSSNPRRRSPRGGTIPSTSLPRRAAGLSSSPSTTSRFVPRSATIPSTGKTAAHRRRPEDTARSGQGKRHCRERGGSEGGVGNRRTIAVAARPAVWSGERFRGRHQANGVHGQLLADLGAHEATDALVLSDRDVDWRSRVGIRGGGLDAVHQAVIHACVAAGAILLHDGHKTLSFHRSLGRHPHRNTGACHGVTASPTEAERPRSSAKAPRVGRKRPRPGRPSRPARTAPWPRPGRGAPRLTDSSGR